MQIQQNHLENLTLQQRCTDYGENFCSKKFNKPITIWCDEAYLAPEIYEGGSCS